MESFEKDYHKCRAAVARGDEEGEEGIPGAKESKNLLTLALELYNFQVISCILIYDIVRVLIKQLDEHSVELLLKVVKSKYLCWLQVESYSHEFHDSCWLPTARRRPCFFEGHDR